MWLGGICRESTDLESLRNNIISMFFKHLIQESDANVEIAQQGLASLMSTQRLPKALLQVCLRPILSNLAFYTKLTLPLLKGLSRLLLNLASWFNVTLGAYCEIAFLQPINCASNVASRLHFF